MKDIEMISDYEQVELLTFHAIYCNGDLKREGPVHVWEILKSLQKHGISERRAREAIDYLKSMQYIVARQDNSNMYNITKVGLNHMKDALVSKGIIKEGCTL
jgi:DNA-binding transcriptional regulator PaaX